MNRTDVVIIGAGASGLMCAIEAAKRGRRVLLLDHANKAGKKILMSGGGRCNFTNYSIEPENFISQNSHFCKSALSRFTQWDFLALIDRYNIPFHEREHGQLFCDKSAKDILQMLLNECCQYKVKVLLNCNIEKVKKSEAGGFSLETNNGKMNSQSLVVASGGLSIPKMGATAFGYQLAKQFNVNVVSTRAGLVPFTWQQIDGESFSLLSGIALPCRVTYQQTSFMENVLFTHRGLSGPAILQLSSYWQPGESILVNLLPDFDVDLQLIGKRQQNANLKVKTVISEWLPKRLLMALLPEELLEIPLQNCSDAQIKQIAEQIHCWRVKPNGTEGYRTAEVTVGGVDCNELSSKTMECSNQPGLYFIGEVVDVTGWLGGYNFQWAWASGWCAGQYV